MEYANAKFGVLIFSRGAEKSILGTLFVDGLGFILAFIGVINPLLAAIIQSSELVFMTNSARLMIDSNGGQTKLWASDSVKT